MQLNSKYEVDEMVQMIFSYSIAMIFGLSGISKISNIKETEKTIMKLNFFRDDLSKAAGRMFPLFEIMISCLLFIYYKSILINIITIFVIFVFIIINIYGLLNNLKDSCNCFGNWFKSKLGLGGLAQSTIMLIALIPNLFINDPSNLLIHYADYQTIIFIIISVIIFTVNIILVRIVLDFEFTNQLEG